MSGQLDTALARAGRFDVPQIPLANDQAARQQGELLVVLAREFTTEPADAIGRLVDEAWARTAGSKVQQFRAILAERYCRDVLRRRSTRRGA